MEIKEKLLSWYDQTLASCSSHQPYPQLALAEVNELLGYIELLQRWGAKIDLVSDLRDDAVIGKHIIDCLMVSRFINYTLKASSALPLIDVGSGAGLPGLVSAMLDKNRIHYLVEPRQKRCVFLNEVVRHLNLANVRVYCADLATLCKSLEINDSIVTHRALDLVDELLKHAKNLISKGGYLVDMVVDKHTKNQSNFNLNESIVYCLPPDNAKRAIVAWSYKG